MNATNQVFVITFALVCMGFLLKQYNFITEKDGKIISKFLMHSTFPALMLVSTSTLKLNASLAYIPLFAVALGLLMLLIAWFWLSDYDNRLRGVLTMGVGGFNTGLFGFSIIEGLFGKESLLYAIMFDIGNTFVVFFVIYTIGCYFSEKQSSQIKPFTILKRVLSLPPVLAMVIGLIINASSWQMPVIMFDFLEILAKGNKPIVLLLMGIYLSFELDKKTMFAVSKVLSIRYLVGSLVVAGLYYWLPNQSTMRSVLMVCSILPIGMTILPFSDEMDFDSRIAGTMLNLSLLISFVLIWALALVLKL